jgi:hypothetical protein
LEEFLLPGKIAKKTDACSLGFRSQEIKSSGNPLSQPGGQCIAAGLTAAHQQFSYQRAGDADKLLWGHSPR